MKKIYIFLIALFIILVFVNTGSSQLSSPREAFLYQRLLETEDKITKNNTQNQNNKKEIYDHEIVLLASKFVGDSRGANLNISIISVDGIEFVISRFDESITMVKLR